jgi:N-acetyl-anhydromuramyl-L-alanine amidase AmpD
MQVNRSRLFKEFFDKSEKRKIKYLVLHHIADKNFDCAIEALKKNQVSSHYIINDDGEIFQLVKEKDIAYHAGHSYWRGEDGLNKLSIGIEFFNSSPFKKKFSKKQIESGIKLIQSIIKKHKIKPENIAGHSDIAYFPDSGKLDRKQDPSHLFPWEELAKNGIGIWPDKLKNKTDKILLNKKNKNSEVKKLKEKLNDFGYKIDNLNKSYDQQLSSVIRVFNRRFNKKIFVKNSDVWYESSDKILDNLKNKIK